MRYDDYHVPVTGHVPLRLKVVQSSFVWNDPYAEAVHVMEYKIINMGVKKVDSAYVGIFNEADVGPACSPGYYQRNYTGYYQDIHTAYVHNPVDAGSTPVGITLLSTSRPLDSLRYAFRWWPGQNHPNTDVAKYQLLASGIIDANQPITSLSDTRCLISFGPFTLRPPGDPLHDTTVVVLGIISGANLSEMRVHAQHAGILLAVNDENRETPSRFELFQNYPNPFNPTTTIRFALPRSAFVRLSVFNIIGEEVATLIDRQLNIGVHSVLWDATGEPSGVYFCKIEAGGFVQTRKLMVLR